MILWLRGDEKQATHSTKCALSFEPGSSELAMLSVSLSHSVGQCGPQLLVSHTIRKGDRRGRNDTQPAHRSRGSGPHETCLSVGTVAVDICLSPSLPGNNGSSCSLAKALCKKKKKEYQVDPPYTSEQHSSFW